MCTFINHGNTLFLFDGMVVKLPFIQHFFAEKAAVQAK